MKNIFLRSVSALLIFCLLCGFYGCEKAPEKTRYTKQYLEYFDTVSTVVGYEETEEDFDKICDFVAAELERYNRLYDIYHKYEGLTNLCTVNQTAMNAPVEVDPDIISMLKFAKDMYEKTGGMTNIAMGSVLSIWHEYREEGIYDPENAKVPPMEDLQAAAQHVNIDDIVLDEKNNTVFLADPDMSIDVGAVAKGYAAERIAKSLEEMGIDNYTINLGGNIRTIGAKADGKGWIAGIQNPDIFSPDKYLLKVAISDTALVTSGTYKRYYYVKDVKYHHIINPETLMPENFYDSVSIITPDSGVADALSTACFNLPLEEGQALVASLENTEAMWVLADGTQCYSDGFLDYLYEE